ncbi:YsnF/AvaK domain-containing protein [uncultured Enterovirga sp.]|uniref:YsnF/AvaK domain-containing protein n=1 Tax=uncultured Enterovirga sp. TaxID=2026352 RepID=UPI0035CA61BE
MTTSTITAMFDKYSDASEAVRRLEAAGVPHDQISIVSNDESHKQYHSGDHDGDHTGTGTGASLGTLVGGGAGLLAGLGLLAIPGLGPVVAAGWLASTLVGAGVGAATGGLVGSLTHAGIDEADAHAYAEGVRRGGTLVTVRAEETMTAKVADILDDHGTIDLDERTTAWRKEGWTGTSGTDNPAPKTGGVGGALASAANAVGHAGREAKDAVMGDRTPGVAARARPQAGYGAASTQAVGHGNDETIPVVEERLHVGKREENRGRVRIHSRVVETPVQEQVTLRDERVSVDRRPVDRALTGADSALFQDRTVEATEHREVPVVSKEARVVEEIGIRKDVDQRTETMSDTVRRTEVEVEDERNRTARTDLAGTSR